MYRLRAKQIARLEERARPFIEERLGSIERWQTVRRGALNHAVVLGFLLRYGEPKIGEPLSEAYNRVSESDGWRLYQNVMPSQYKFIHDDEKFTPHSRNSVLIVGEVLRHLFVSRLPGRTEKDKLNAIFKSVPPWIIWFTYADYTAAVLDLELPDLSSIRRCARPREGFDVWWGLPWWEFKPCAWPKNCESELARTDLNLLRPEPGGGRLLTRRERKRGITASPDWADEWPSEYPLEWLRLLRTDFRAAMAQVGDPVYMPEKRHPEFCGEMEPRLRHRSYGDRAATLRYWQLPKDLERFKRKS